MAVLEDAGARVRHTDDGVEKQCLRCTDWWPADREFFHVKSSGSCGLASWCRACHAEWRNARRAGLALPAARAVALAGVSQ